MWRLRRLGVACVALFAIASVAGCAQAREAALVPGGSSALSQPAGSSVASDAEPTTGGMKRVVEMRLSSPVLDSSGSQSLPAKYAMKAIPGGQNISIPYAWEDVPGGTRSLVLVLVDTAPVAQSWVHWVVVNIPVSASGLAEGASGTSAMPRGAHELRNTFGFAGYGGPQPPSGSGVHTYAATLLALDVATVDVSGQPKAAEVEAACSGHVLARATCAGRFGR